MDGSAFRRALPRKNPVFYFAFHLQKAWKMVWQRDKRSAAVSKIMVQRSLRLLMNSVKTTMADSVAITV
jgi:hypothetical protein